MLPVLVFVFELLHFDVCFSPHAFGLPLLASCLRQFVPVAALEGFGQLMLILHILVALLFFYLEHMIAHVFNRIRHSRRSKVSEVHAFSLDHLGAFVPI